VLLRHLVCAAHERPLSGADAALFGAELPEIAAVLSDAQQLRHEGDRWYWSGAGYPAGEVDLRTTGGEPYTILHAGEENRLLGTDTLIGSIEQELPPTSYRTEGLWFVVPPAIQIGAAREGIDLLGTIHAIEHAAIGLAPLQVMCDRWDLGGVSNPNHPDTSLP